MGLPAEGDVVRGYRIVGTLGRGGLGTTFDAVRESTGERVALKRLAVVNVDEWKRIELFEREARVLERLQHPGIPRYLEHFTVEGGDGPALYIAEELVVGRSLAEVVRTGTAPLDEMAIRRLAEELLRVLDYLGRLTPPVIHRDIKPENVLQRSDGSIALVDFGAARADVARPGGGSTTVGTYGYMAPEQLHGDASPATDIYGLACTLLFLLTGRSPTDLPRKKLQIDVLAAASGRVTPPFARWLEKALQPAPEDRFLSAHAALGALRGLPGGGGPRVDLGDGSGKRARPLTWVLLALLLMSTGFGAWVFVKRGALEYVNYGVRAGGGEPGPLPARWPHWTPPVTFVRWWGAHMSAVFSVAVSPLGNRIASGSNDGTVKIWDVATGDPVRALPGHTGRVGGVTWSPDGSLVASGGDASVLVQDVKTGATRLTLATGAQATSVDISPDGKRIAAGSVDGAVHIWSLDGGTLLTTLAGGGRVLSVRFSPDNRLIAAAAGSNVLIWDTQTGAAKQTLTGHHGDVDAVAWAPDGRILASAGDDHTVRVWIAAEGHAISTLSEASDEVWSLAFDPRGKYLATVGKEGILRVYDAMTQALVAYRELEKKGILSVAWGPDGTTVATGDGVGRVGVLSMAFKSKADDVPAIPTQFPAAKEGPGRVVFARAMAMADGYDGHKTVLDDAEALLREGMKDEAASPLMLAGLSRITMKRGYQSSEAYSKASLTAADELVDRALTLAPTLPEAHTQRGWLHYFEKNDARAKDEAMAADRLAPTARNDALLAEIAFRANDVNDAEKRTMHALTLDAPSELQASYTMLQQVAHSRGDPAAEERIYERMLEVDPKGAWTKGNFAGFLIGREKYDRAIEMAEAALKISDYGAAHQVLAHAYTEKGADALWGTPSAPDAAKAAFDSAVAADPSYAHAHYGLGAYFRKLALGRREKALLTRSSDEFEKAAKLDKDPHLARVAREENDRLAGRVR
jgi:Tfp pilus assembly protein PilF